jgi:hypothetical protein
VDLPFEAFGKRLRFALAAPRFAAGEVSFTRAELEVMLRRLPQRPAAEPLPSERCKPPHFLNCRE